MSTSAIDEDSPLSLSLRRRQASRELMRAEILTAAEHIIRNHGLDALSLRALAKAVGVTAPALYEYFPNKDAILRALFVQGSELMLGLMDQLIQEQPAGLQTLLQTLDGYRRFARDEPDYFRLLFGTVDPNLALTDVEYAGMKLIFERFTGIISSAVEREELRPLPLETLSCALWALVHGVAMLETDSFMARKDVDGDGKRPQFDAAVKLALLRFATPKGAELIGPLEFDN
jgi:AcrR family transcriptional regulator